jgi:hypothetical protein
MRLKFRLVPEYARLLLEASSRRSRSHTHSVAHGAVRPCWQPELAGRRNGDTLEVGLATWLHSLPNGAGSGQS